MPAQNEEGFRRVATGMLDEPALYRRQLVTAAIGWILTVLLMVWLVSSANEIALQITMFLIAVSVVVAIVGIGAGVDLFRSARITSNAPARGLPKPAVTIDALSRPLSLPSDPEELGADMTIEMRDGIRVYRKVER
jgi:hypothetical protein